MSYDGSGSIAITSDGCPGGTRVEFGGQDISRSVRSVTWRHDARGVPHVQVEFIVVPLSVLAPGQVEWHGLDEVPTEALQQEIDRRRTS